MGLVRNILRYLYPSETDLFRLLIFAFLTKEGNGEKTQFKAMFGSFFLDFQSIDCPCVTQLNFVIDPDMCEVLDCLPICCIVHDIIRQSQFDVNRGTKPHRL